MFLRRFFAAFPLMLWFTASAQINYTDYVDPYIGSAAHGHVFVGANVPFGAVQLGPTNIETGWDWCSGYHYSSNNIVGFAHTHLSGTGIGDLGDLLVMPATGRVIVEKGIGKDFSNGYTSTFTRSNEVVKPGYYSVVLDKYNIKAELTATERVGFHQYIFPTNAETPHLIIDLAEGIGWDRPVETYIQQLNPNTLVGYRFSAGWAADQRVFFAIEFSQPLSSLNLFDTTALLPNTTEAKARRIKASANFNSITGNVVRVKVGISPVSTKNALENINAELPGWDFTGTVAKANAKWNRELSRVKVDADKPTMRVFYTGLYHAMIAPSLFNDANGEYRGTDKKVYSNPGFQNYTTFSLWDTYRTWHPLSTIIFPDKVDDYVKSFLAIYKQQGKLPVWHLHGNETNTMVGYSAVPVLVDAYLKGYRNYDINLAYEAVKQSAMQQHDGIEYIQQLKHIPAEKVNESVAKSMEYAISDWAISQMAKSLGKKDDHTYFIKRSKLYNLYFDQSRGFMRGKMADGSWRTPFDPRTSRHRDDDYTEGNAWQYTFLVPQDVEGLISLFGGEKSFTTKLDSLFTVPAALSEESSPDISGLIGNYAHGNEPGHHTLYLYAFAGQQWKTAKWVRQVMNDFYTDKPDGLCGNEDVGQMSAWYLMSALGLYPVNPANGAYVFGSPMVNQATIDLPGGKKFTVKAVNNSKDNIYIQKVSLNGKAHTKSFITHSDVMKGGTLVFYMGSKPSTFGTKKADRPVSNVAWK